MKTTLRRPFGIPAALVMASALLTTTALAGKMSGTHMFDMGMKPILKQYLLVQTALASDSTAGVQQAARSIATHAAKLDAKSVTGEHAKHYQHLPMNLKKSAKILSKATTIDAARKAFKELSKPMAMWGTMSQPDGVDVLFCSMAKASWLQKHGDVKNPYYGAELLGCGEVVGGAAHSMKSMDHGKGGMNHGEHGGH